MTAATQPTTAREAIMAMADANRKWLVPDPIAAPKRIPLNVLQLAVRQHEHPEVKRPCGECNACCTELGVMDLGKPHRTKCVHEIPGGCKIYGSHPPDCAEFDCLWKIGWGDPEADRPDRSGVLLQLDLGTDVTELSVRVLELRPGAVDVRFPGGPDVNLVGLVNNAPGVGVVLVRHGVPTAFDGEVAPEYAVDPPRPAGQTMVNTTNNVTSVQIGVLSEDGFVHTKFGRLPAG